MDVDKNSYTFGFAAIMVIVVAVILSGTSIILKDAQDSNVELEKKQNILRSVGNYVYNHLKSNKVLINPPQGAFYLMPEFLNNKYKNSTELCEAILEETGVAMLPASEFGFNPKRMLTRLSYIDFNGKEFLNAPINGKILNDKIIEKYAPNVAEGIEKLSNWAKNL